MAITDRSVVHDRWRRGAHALLVVLLLLATTGAAVHPYALDEHRSGHPCGVCVASSHGGAAPLPDAFTLIVPRASRPPAIRTEIVAAAVASSPYRARAPPV